jgi:hypoxanthine phosphoribosyltransferase
VKELISADAISARVGALGAEIARDYEAIVREGGELVLAAVLKGSFVFASDLARAIDLPLRVEFLGVQSYGDATESGGDVRLTLDLAYPVAGAHVLLVEDIVDTGLTLSYLLDMLRARGPASLKVCALLDKPSRRRVPAKADYLGFVIDDVFVVGYGTATCRISR